MLLEEAAAGEPVAAAEPETALVEPPAAEFPDFAPVTMTNEEPAGEPEPATVEPEPAAKAPRKAAARRGVSVEPRAHLRPIRRGTKQTVIRDLLARERGATMGELITALSSGREPWLPQTVRSGLYRDMNHQKGYGVRTAFMNAEELFDHGHWDEAGALGWPMMDLPHPDECSEEQRTAARATVDMGATVNVYFLVVPEGIEVPADLPSRVEERTARETAKREASRAKTAEVVARADELLARRKALLEGKPAAAP